MAVFNLIRLIVFGVLLLFSVIELAVSASVISDASGLSFPGFSVAVSVITILVLVPMFVIERLRKGAVTSFVAVELGYMGILWVLWLACAGNNTSALMGFGSVDCGVSSSFLGIKDSTFESYCRRYQALQAFAWLNWIAVFFYWVALLIFAFVAMNNGNKNVWMTPTTEMGNNTSNFNGNGGEPKVPNPQNYQQYPQNTGTQYPQNTGGTYGAPGQYPPQQPGYGPSPVGSPAPPPNHAIQV